MYADHFLFGASLNCSAVDCVVRAGTTKLFLSGLSEGCVMEADTAGPLSYGLFVNSPDAKSQMAIHILNGVSVRAAYKAMRKRMRVEARRQRELEEGRPPEVLLESFLEMLKHKLRCPPELPKRALTSTAKAAKHRRARDKRRSETPCWWIANGKECFKGDRCAFKHFVSQVQGQTVSKTGVSSPSLSTDHDGNRMKVPLPHPVAEFTPCPSATPEPQRSAAGSVPHVSSAMEFQGPAVSVLGSSGQELKEDPARDYWIKVWNECSPGDSLFDGWSDDSPCHSGAGAQHKFYPDNSWRSEHWKRDSWHSSHCRTTDGTWSKHLVYDGSNSSHWKTTGWDQERERERVTTITLNRNGALTPSLSF